MDIAERRGGDFGSTVMNRLQDDDVFHVKARYHSKCFSWLLNVEQKEVSVSLLDNESSSILEALDEHIESSDNFQFTLSKLHDFVGNNVFNNKTLCSHQKRNLAITYLFSNIVVEKQKYIINFLIFRKYAVMGFATEVP